MGHGAWRKKRDERDGRSRETKRSSVHGAMPLEVAGALRLMLEAEERLWIAE
jgi:hypothetical protein